MNRSQFQIHFNDDPGLKADRFMEHSDKFLQWLKDSDAFISPKIAIKDYSEEGARLGVVALEDIKKDEILFTIPRKCILSRSTSKFRDQIRKNCKKVGWVPLMWSIILEKLSEEDSFWNPYFKILPDEIYLPSIWKDEDLSLLDGTGIELMIPDSSEQYRKYFLNIKGSFPQTANISEKEFERLFHYAGCLISGYSFCEDPDQELDIALVPLADTLNHRTGFNNARLYYEKEALKMVCYADCPKGEQLFNTYGDLGNRDLLVKYGFVDDPNPFHAVTFDPIEWLRDHVQQSKIGGGDVKRVCDSDPSAFNLFDKFDGKLPCQLVTSSNYDFSGMKTFIDWIYLLSLPSKTSPNSLKPRSSYETFLSNPENVSAILEILKARRSLLPESKINVSAWNYGPKLYTQIIKNQDIEILDGYISFLKNKL